MLNKDTTVRPEKWSKCETYYNRQYVTSKILCVNAVLSSDQLCFIQKIMIVIFYLL